MHAVSSIQTEKVPSFSKASLIAARKRPVPKQMSKETSTISPAPAGGKEESPRLPDHLVALPGGEWALWRWSALRGAGFAASRVLELSVPECATAADRLLDEEEKAEESLEEALSALRREIAATDGEKRAGLRKALRELKKGKAPLLDDMKPETEMAV